VVENVCDNKYHLNIYTALPQFSFTNVTFPLTFQFLIIFGTGFVVLTMARIHNVVWVRTPYSGTYMVMNVLEEHFRSVYTGHQLTAAVVPRQIVCAGPFRLHVSIRLRFLNFLYICHALFQFVTKNVCTHFRK
jgi:hypothetical protein